MPNGKNVCAKEAGNGVITQKCLPPFCPALLTVPDLGLRRQALTLVLCACVSAL